MDTVEIRRKTESTIEWEGYTPEGKPFTKTEAPTEIRLKSYEFGYQTESIDELIDKKTLTKDKYIQIFKSSRSILKKIKKDTFLIGLMVLFTYQHVYL